MNNNLELIYWTNSGGVELPLEDWQYKVIAQVLGLSIQEDKNGNITFSHFPKDFVMKRVEKMGILIPVVRGPKVNARKHWDGESWILEDAKTRKPLLIGTRSQILDEYDRRNKSL